MFAVLICLLQVTFDWSITLWFSTLNLSLWLSSVALNWFSAAVLCAFASAIAVAFFAFSAATLFASALLNCASASDLLAFCSWMFVNEHLFVWCDGNYIKGRNFDPNFNYENIQDNNLNEAPILLNIDMNSPNCIPTDDTSLNILYTGFNKSPIKLELKNAPNLLVLSPW